MTAQNRRLTSVHTALLATLVALATAPFAFAEQTKTVSNGETANPGCTTAACAWTVGLHLRGNTTTAGTVDIHRLTNVYDDLCWEITR